MSFIINTAIIKSNKSNITVKLSSREVASELQKKKNYYKTYLAYLGYSRAKKLCRNAIKIGFSKNNRTLCINLVNQGVTFAPGIYIFVNIGKFGIPYFDEFATDTYETWHIYSAW